jgi:hypothetical protein
MMSTAGPMQAGLQLGIAEPETHPGTDCSNSTSAGTVLMYQRTMPEPNRANVCVHFDARSGRMCRGA